MFNQCLILLREFFYGSVACRAAAAVDSAEPYLAFTFSKALVANLVFSITKHYLPNKNKGLQQIRKEVSEEKGEEATSRLLPLL
jgi:hypothetical protein